MSNTGQQELIDGLGEGDSSGLQQLLFTDYDSLLRYIQGRLPDWLRDSLDAEDIVQETHINVFRGIDQFRGTSMHSFRLWVRTIAMNQLRNAIRSSTRKKRGGDRRRARTTTDVDSSLPADLMDFFPDVGASPSGHVANQEAAHAIRIGIAALPVDQREAINLRYIEKMTVLEAAEAMKKSPGALRGLLQRGRQAIKDSLQESTKWFSR